MHYLFFTFLITYAKFKIIIFITQQFSDYVLLAKQVQKKSTTGLSAVISLFNLYTEHIMRNAGLDELQAGIKKDGRNINNLRYADDISLGAEN